MQVIYDGSVRTTFYPFGHLLPRKKNLATVYSTFMVHGTWKKTQLALDLHWKKKYSCFRLQYHYDAWNLKKSILLDHHRKKYIFVSDYSVTVMHRTKKIFNRHSTPPKENCFSATVILWSTGHRNYNV